MSGGRIRAGSVRLKDAGNVVPIRDGLISLLTGMGTTTDPRSYSRYHARQMSDHEIDQAYRGSWVCRKAIDKPATEMVREWRDWQAESSDIAKIEAEEKRLDLRNKVRRAEILRGLGGAGMVLYVGGSDEEQANAIDPTKIKAGDLKAIHVWHRSRFTLGDMITTWADPWFGHPAYYEVQLQSTGANKAIRFHPSRVVAFKAEQVGDIIGTSWVDLFWGQSRVQTIIEAVKNVDTADNGFAALIKDARNRRIYIPGLLNMVSGPGGEQQLAKRLQAFALGESSNSVSWLDGGKGGKDGEGSERIEDRQMSWAGMPDIMAAYRTAAAAAADMPATVLWGISPQGMNATGDSDITLWHKTIKGRQDLDLSPCMTQIDGVLIPSALGKVNDSIWYEWAPLSTQSEKDEATTFKDTMTGLDTLAASQLVPTIALEKAVQNLLTERGWMPGLDDALGELDETERYPSLSEPDPTDPSEPATEPNPQPGAKGGGQVSAGAGVQPPAARRRAANDARLVLDGIATLTDAERATILAIFGEVDEGSSLPFGDGRGGYNPQQPRGPDGRWASSGSWIDRVLANHFNLKGVAIGKVGAKATHLEKLGHRAAGKKLALDSSFVRHIDQHHGQPRRDAKGRRVGEWRKGQRPVVRADIANAARTFHASTFTPSRLGRANRFEGVATVNGERIVTVWETRKHAVVLADMWIIK